MFGSKKSDLYADQDARNGDHKQEYEYRTIAMIGAAGFDKMMNERAAEGWELVNGCMAGTTHYGYLRRKVARP